LFELPNLLDFHLLKPIRQKDDDENNNNNSEEIKEKPIEEEKLEDLELAKKAEEKKLVSDGKFSFFL
jgi:hypothetical protein